MAGEEDGGGCYSGDGGVVAVKGGRSARAEASAALTAKAEAGGRSQGDAAVGRSGGAEGAAEQSKRQAGGGGAAATAEADCDGGRRGWAARWRQIAKKEGDGGFGRWSESGEGWAARGGTRRRHGWSGAQGRRRGVRPEKTNRGGTDRASGEWVNGFCSYPLGLMVFNLPTVREGGSFLVAAAAGTGCGGALRRRTVAGEGWPVTVAAEGGFRWCRRKRGWRCGRSARRRNSAAGRRRDAEVGKIFLWWFGRCWRRLMAAVEASTGVMTGGKGKGGTSRWEPG
ncbi:uncharacterized PE-PGRS family protein PE_PGRS54-like [Phoenix dactylifera]|uniref:Uncharacterized PE-PGRS family protein PE_PGRS54-like n=1 Tax=Phoenix dactylifera TaxID=42345 RepID=A0A8B9AMZ4_PHODC|nr:uncharacterized PE-PGRS family protein PE_PGRS54-like [Phoenix dactylifera]